MNLIKIEKVSMTEEERIRWNDLYEKIDYIKCDTEDADLNYGCCRMLMAMDEFGKFIEVIE